MTDPDEQPNENTPLVRRKSARMDYNLHHQESRNEQFDPGYEPFEDNHHLQLNDGETNGALWFMNPTRATFSYLGSAEAVYDETGGEEYASNSQQQNVASATARRSSSDIEYRWTSRNNRKGRHELVVHTREDSVSQYDTPPTGISSVLKGIWRMATKVSFGDISYITAIFFTLACVFLVVNAVISVLQYVLTSWKPPQGIIYVEGVLTFIGCAFFLTSSFLSFIEAVNANKSGCFGWKREHISYHDPSDPRSEHGATTRIVPDWDCIHKRNNYANLFSNSDKQNEDDDCGNTNSCGDGNGTYKGKDSSDCENQQWRYFPTLHDLRTHFIYDLGFVTCTLLFLSSLVYCSAALASLISILVMDQIAHPIRIPQIIAGIGFAISSFLFMLETQTSWFVPELRVIGWWISAVNLIGSIGFTICAAMALRSAEPDGEWAEYQLVYSYLWGSMGFLLGSLMQWYEALDKHPVEKKTDQS